MARADPLTMQVFLAWLRREHGSAEGLLLGAGLEREAVDVLRARLVDSAAA
jgi:hypothetical protein